MQVVDLCARSLHSFELLPDDAHAAQLFVIPAEVAFEVFRRRELGIERNFNLFAGFEIGGDDPVVSRIDFVQNALE